LTNPHHHSTRPHLHRQPRKAVRARASLCEVHGGQVDALL
jgi:hypothetical protein